MRRTRRPDLIALALLQSYLLVCTPIYAAAPGAVRHVEPNAVYVTDVAGEVDLSLAGGHSTLQIGSELPLPARIVTADDGTVGLQQAGTSISIAPRSDIEIPAAAADGQLIARLVQRRGHVFYDVAQRDVEKLRIETPYLVAVVKGTQFNVAVQDGTTKISLFEGRLEIRTPDGAEVIDLEAGEIAIRSSTDPSIRVLSMNAASVPDRPELAPRLDASADITAAAIRPAELAAALSSDRLDGNGAIDTRGGATLGLAGLAGSTAGTGIDTGGAALGMESLALQPSAPALAFDLGLSSGLDAGLDLGGVTADVGLDAGLDLGAVTADVGLDAGLDLGAVTADVGLDAGLDLGAVTADVGLDAGLDLGAGTADLGLDAGLDLGGVTADVGLDAGLDLGAGSADLGLDTGLDLGGATADVGLDAGLDVGDGSADLGLDTGLDLGGATADIGLDAGLDVGGDTGLGVDAGVDVGGVGADLSVGDGGIDLDVDLGGGDGGVLDVLTGGSGLLGGLL